MSRTTAERGKSGRKPSRAGLRRIRLVVLDVDGVLSDGRVYVADDGSELRSFDVRDGYGIRKASGRGIRFALISGKSSKSVAHRARELGIAEVHQGVTDKRKAILDLMTKFGLRRGEVCCIGDDEPDLPMLAEAGITAAPPGAMAIVRASVQYVTAAAGGRGAVREVIDLILESRTRDGR